MFGVLTYSVQGHIRNGIWEFDTKIYVFLCGDVMCSPLDDSFIISFLVVFYVDSIYKYIYIYIYIYIYMYTLRGFYIMSARLWADSGSAHHISECPRELVHGQAPALVFERHW